MLFFVFIFFSLPIFPSTHLTNMLTKGDVKNAIDTLVRTGDFEYFSDMSSEKGVCFFNITSNIQEKNYIISFRNSWVDHVSNTIHD